ncbi:hypothetical protein GX50_02818 [[Emmonsia] crescens]|uniref:Uncharacterized protein n=1 Tax=[Emmonsia] crescens TaxID=73230 RepID=A0A2B7ZL30_9EURO|nr:hypothetical protein GX50_02818 [Emmonsia crescens]
MYLKPRNPTLQSELDNAAPTPLFTRNHERPHLGSLIPLLDILWNYAKTLRSIQYSSPLPLAHDHSVKCCPFYTIIIRSFWDLIVRKRTC